MQPQNTIRRTVFISMFLISIYTQCLSVYKTQTEVSKEYPDTTWFSTEQQFRVPTQCGPWRYAPIPGTEAYCSQSPMLVVGKSGGYFVGEVPGTGLLFAESSVIEKMQARAKKIADMCPKGVRSNFDMLTSISNPFAFPNECLYYGYAEIVQMWTANEGLFIIREAKFTAVHLILSKPFTGRLMGDPIFKAMGTHTYKTAQGLENTVPSYFVVDFESY
ncbi:MAG: hypothetical protein JNM27_13745 [Leptospirales bacterium]|nr:hypothetical protein [Leptospirales bacterium]